MSLKKYTSHYFTFFAIIQGAQLLKRLVGIWVGAEGKGLRPSSDRDGKIYRLAVPVPK